MMEEQAMNREGASLPAPVSFGQRAKLFGAASLLVGAPLEILGAGGAGLMLACATGAAAAYFTEEVQAVLPERFRAPNLIKPGGKLQKNLHYVVTGEHAPAKPEEPAPVSEVQEEQASVVETATANQEIAGPQDIIDLAPDLRLPLSHIAGKAIFVCGIRRHGKTTIGARIAEQLGKHHIPLFIPCLEGDYLSLADVLPRAVVAGPSSVAGQYSAYDFAGLNDSSQAYQFGYDILELGFQVILDLEAYGDLDKAIAIQINVIRGMFHWANSHPDRRVPAHVYLDEAQRYLPQTLSDSVLTDKIVIAELLKTYMDVIAIGGKRGIAPVVLTQRFAQVNKKIMAQSEIFFLMRQTNDSDLARCMEYVDSSTATKDQISKFQPGQGVYIASDGTQMVTQFHERESSGERSATPQPDAAKRYAGMPKQRPATSQAGSVATSSTASERRSNLHLVKQPEERPEEARSGDEVDEVASPALSERERRIGEMFFNEGINPGAILKELYPDVRGGDRYQKANAEITDAIRKYAARKGA